MMFYRQCLKAVTGVLGVVAVSSIVWACGGYGAWDIRELPVLVEELGEQSRGSAVVQQESQRPLRTVAILRTRGQAGLNAAIEHRHRRVAALGGTEFAEIENLDAFIDQIAGQKSAVNTGLYWHMSLRDAQQSSRLSGRPILSLRMLGRLDQDLSCANSRYFRTMLYTDPNIASTLRKQFVLHWQSVRDVPVVTIDFGGGRELRQPLTGNSVHLVLDSEGRPFEALPGMTSPQSFQTWLAEVDQFWRDTHGDDQATFWSSVANHHRDRAERRRAESPMATAKDQSVSDLNPLDRRWSDLATTVEVQLASTSQQLVSLIRPDAEAGMVLAATKMVAEIPMLRVVQPIEQNVARDTVFNLYALQTRIDDWFTDAAIPADYDSLTQRIYADAFLMPLDDPWLGLSPDPSYAALDNGGRIEPVTSLSKRIGFPQ